MRFLTQITLIIPSTPLPFHRYSLFFAPLPPLQKYCRTSVANLHPLPKRLIHLQNVLCSSKTSYPALKRLITNSKSSYPAPKRLIQLQNALSTHTKRLIQLQHVLSSFRTSYPAPNKHLIQLSKQRPYLTLPYLTAQCSPGNRKQF